MRKRILSAVALSAAAALTLSGCGSSADDSTDGGDGAAYSVANVVNGNLGDQGFFDDAERGITALADQGLETKTLQADAADPAQWKANLESVSNGKFDMAVVGTWQMNDILLETAEKFPDQQYLIYDSFVDAPNVASLQYAQNEGSFLAGVLAASAVKEQLPLAKGSKSVGFVGGQDAPPIDDFFAGFEAGVQAVDPEMKVLDAYVGDYVDSNKAHDLTTAMYKDGAGVVFAVAGGAGLGVLQAAKDADRYAIGVDSNQNGLQEGHILASMLKNIGTSITLAVDAAQNDELKFGESTVYGLANDGVGLTFEGNGDIVPEEIVTLVEDYKAQIVAGDITVPTTL